MSADTESFSPSSRKPAEAVADWLARGLPVEVRSFEPATEAQVRRAHAREYVDGIMSCQLPNGFNNRSRAVADSLPYTVGSMLAAANHVLENGGIACSPSSGFHHARYAEAGGYCTFNGLMVTALDVLAHHPGARIAIIDFDMHYGDGTDDIIKRLGLQKSIVHISAGLHYSEGMGAEFTKALRLHMLHPVFEYLRGDSCDLVLYQAGADQHISDPLGGLLNTEQMRRRDATVFNMVAGLGVPTVFNLAGGYQKDSKGTIEPVLALHRNTVLEALKAKGKHEC